MHAENSIAHIFVSIQVSAVTPFKQNVWLRHFTKLSYKHQNNTISIGERTETRASTRGQ